MECKFIQNVLIDFIEGKVSDDLKIQIEEHLLICENCRLEHKQTRQLLDDLNDLEDENPDNILKEDFYIMLEQEKENLAQIDKKIEKSPLKINWNILKYAASAILILGFGFILGQNIQLKSYQNSEISQLRSELDRMQQTTSLVSLSQPTASQRLKAIYVIGEQIKSDDKTINILLNTFKNDENINVRMAAANALAKYPENEEVRNIFISELEKANDAALQITLINLLTQIQDKRAKSAFEKIIKNEQSIPAVKQQAEEGLKVFI